MERSCSYNGTGNGGVERICMKYQDVTPVAIKATTKQES